MDAYERLVRFLGQWKLFTVPAAVVAPPIDRALYRWTRGRLRLLGTCPVLLLTTVGRKTGIARTQPVLYLGDGERLVLAATNWGKRRHPAWSSNLLANPQARVQLNGTVDNYRARLATPAEREQLWPRLVELWPAFETYRASSGRVIRVFILEPREPRASVTLGRGG